MPSKFSFDLRTLDTTVVLYAEDTRTQRQWLNGLATLSQSLHSSRPDGRAGLSIESAKRGLDAPSLRETSIQPGTAAETEEAGSDVAPVTLVLRLPSGAGSEPLNVSMAQLGECTCRIPTPCAYFDIFVREIDSIHPPRGTQIPDCPPA